MKAEHDLSEARRELVHLRRVLTSDFEVWKYFQYQFTVINQRTQTVFGLGGLAITVTGFSGQRIVASSLLSGMSLVIGLVCVLAALVITISGVSRLKWLSKCLGPDTEASFLEIISLRDKKARLFRIALIVLVVGLFWYVLAISIYLLKSTSGGF